MRPALWSKMPRHQTNLPEIHAQTGCMCVPRKTAPSLAEVGGGGIVWCVCIPIDNLRRYFSLNRLKALCRLAVPARPNGRAVPASWNSNLLFWSRIKGRSSPGCCVQRLTQAPDERIRSLYGAALWSETQTALWSFDLTRSICAL